jgi:hypothetical protein
MDPFKVRRPHDDQQPHFVQSTSASTLLQQFRHTIAVAFSDSDNIGGGE